MLETIPRTPPPVKSSHSPQNTKSSIPPSFPPLPTDSQLLSPSLFFWACSSSHFPISQRQRYPSPSSCLPVLQSTLSPPPAPRWVCFWGKLLKENERRQGETHLSTRSISSLSAVQLGAHAVKGTKNMIFPLSYPDRLTSHKLPLSVPESSLKMLKRSSSATSSPPSMSPMNGMRKSLSNCL